MRSFLRHAAAGAVAVSVLAFAAQAQAGLIFSLSEFTGDPATGIVEVEQDGDNLKFTASVTSPADADIRAIWFNVNNMVNLANLVATGADVTGHGTSLPPDANVTPESFDFGVLFGGPGDNNILSTMFILSSTVALDLNSFFEDGDAMGMRLKSVNGEGSSKLTGELIRRPPTQVPEPAMAGLFLAGLAGLGWVNRRRKAA